MTYVKSITFGEPNPTWFYRLEEILEGERLFRVPRTASEDSGRDRRRRSICSGSGRGLELRPDEVRIQF